MRTVKECRKELDRIASIEDYDDEDDAFQDGGTLIEIATVFENEIDRLCTEVSSLKTIIKNMTGAGPAQ